MKKFFMLFLSILVLFVNFALEGGSLAQLIAPTILIPIIVCPILTTLFSYRLDEIIFALKLSFCDKPTTKAELEKDLLIVNNLDKAIISWSWTILIISLIAILSFITRPDALGHAIAGAILSLLYGYGMRAAFLVPVEQSLRKKLNNA